MADPAVTRPTLLPQPASGNGIPDAAGGSATTLTLAGLGEPGLGGVRLRWSTR
ncbi:hypothetical protein [Micromonospora globbae]|uniref:Uncharacterized protein n=1 Tax=Micromonospora globbae TaxID=1894969 RepID=A0ABZ1SBQ4_9ACTN|nr:hypothetical protein [Micromonospora globbae]